jgi:hypothetical protein
MDMTTAMAKALVDGLETEGVESIWAKLNQKNAPGYIKEPAPEGMLFVARHMNDKNSRFLQLN